MDKLTNIMKENKRLKPLINDIQTYLIVKKSWMKIVGAFMAKQISVSYVRRNTLYCESKNPCWIHDIALYQEQILQKIETLLNEKKIKKLKVLKKHKRRT